MIVQQGSKQVGGSDTNCWNQKSSKNHDNISIEDFYRYNWIGSSIQSERKKHYMFSVSIGKKNYQLMVD